MSFSLSSHSKLAVSIQTMFVLLSQYDPAWRSASTTEIYESSSDVYFQAIAMVVVLAGWRSDCTLLFRLSKSTTLFVQPKS